MEDAAGTTGTKHKRRVLLRSAALKWARSWILYVSLPSRRGERYGVSFSICVSAADSASSASWAA